MLRSVHQRLERRNNPRRAMSNATVASDCCPCPETGTAMLDYRRYFVPGGTYFFSIVTYQRCVMFADDVNVQ